MTDHRQAKGRSRGLVWLGTGCALTTVGVVTWLVAARPAVEPQATPQAVSTRPVATPANGYTVVVFKDPNCGCCANWVEHLAAAGFEVRTTNTSDLPAVKRAHGVPGALQSCHTALVDGYVIEGHVPAVDVERLLRERPAVAGLAVPGMPVGSPGMEVPGAGVDPYDVVTFDASGQTGVFARHR